VAGLVVVVGRLLKLGVSEEVVLNPELRAGPFQEGIDGHARLFREEATENR
jgi:hypothetical protein